MISDKTMRLVAAVVLRHVPLPTARALFREMVGTVPGNRSFRDSIQAIDMALHGMDDDKLLTNGHGEVLKVTETHVIRYDGEHVMVHRVVDGREQRPNGYLLGSNMTEVK